MSEEIKPIQKSQLDEELTKQQQELIDEIAKHFGISDDALWSLAREPLNKSPFSNC